VQPTDTVTCDRYSHGLPFHALEKQQEALEQAKQEAGLEELAREISDLAQQSKQIEADMASLRELMRKLNLQADARAKLAVKKGQQKEREEAYLARCVPVNRQSAHSS
jgi:ribosomal protein S6